MTSHASHLLSNFPPDRYSKRYSESLVHSSRSRRIPIPITTEISLFGLQAGPLASVGQSAPNPSTGRLRAHHGCNPRDSVAVWPRRSGTLSREFLAPITNCVYTLGKRAYTWTHYRRHHPHDAPHQHLRKYQMLNPCRRCAMKALDKYTIAELEPYAREWLRRRRAEQRSRPKIERPCPHCGRPFGARDMRAHKPTCTAKAAAPVTRRTK
jgi:hypothetical protein